VLAAHVMPLQMTTPATPISISIRRTPSLAAPNGLAGILTFVLDAVRAPRKKHSTRTQASIRFEMSGTSARMRRMSAADRAAADKASEWIAQVRTG
jgi:hypothetical protein